MGRGWLVCGWCGTHQLARRQTKGIMARLAGFVLLAQALGIVGATVALAVVWAMRGWTVERGQTLGIIWLGVIILLGFIAWASVNVTRSQEHPPLYALRERASSR